MARVITYGFIELDKLLNAWDLNDVDIQRIVNAGAKVYKEELPKYYQKIVRPRPNAGTANVADHVIIKGGRTKTSPCAYVTFDNKVVHGKDVHVNEVAFLQEYGKHNVAGRPFIKATIDECERAPEAMRDEFERLQSEKGF